MDMINSVGKSRIKSKEPFVATGCRICSNTQGVASLACGSFTLPWADTLRPFRANL